MALLIVLGDWVARIPTGALVAVMITVSIGTFDWKSLAQIRRMPLTETIVMVGTVLTVVLTHDLSMGVLVGVLLSAVFFARSVGKLVEIEHTESPGGGSVYVVRGELFFVSVEQFVAAFDFRTPADEVEIDLAQAHVWDGSAVAALDRVVLELRSRGAQVRVTGLNARSSALLERIGTYDRPDVVLTSGH